MEIMLVDSTPFFWLNITRSILTRKIARVSAPVSGFLRCPENTEEGKGLGGLLRLPGLVLGLCGVGHAAPLPVNAGSSCAVSCLAAGVAYTHSGAVPALLQLVWSSDRAVVGEYQGTPLAAEPSSAKLSMPSLPSSCRQINN